MITLDLEDTARDNSEATVASVKLAAFRNYAELFVELEPSFNVIAGPNAQGKTNFLEALFLLSTTRLLRGQRDAEAVLDGRREASVTADLYGGRTQLGIVLEAGVRKRASINGLNLTRASDLIGRLPCVCICSLDLSIVRGEPGDRRLFLDLALSSLYPSYLRHLTNYKRALEQRNALLRESRDFMHPAVLFEPWEDQIGWAGAALRQVRRRFVEAIAPVAAMRHGLMGDGESLELRYAAKDESLSPEELRHALEASRSHDVARGGTSVGPHRDDLLIEIDGRDARLFGSQGQQRTSVIALKLATLHCCKEELGNPPMLLLDDILSDLDERRRSLLVNLVVEEAGQTVLTCTEAAAAGPDILSRARVFEVRAGTMRQASH